MSIEKILLPDIGDFKDSKIIEVLIKKGDQVEQEQSLIVLESDKASMEVPSPLSGKVLQVKVKEGSTINVGDLIVEIEPDKATAEKAEDKTEEKTEQKTEKIANNKCRGYRYGCGNSKPSRITNLLNTPKGGSRSTASSNNSQSTKIRGDLSRQPNDTSICQSTWC